MGFQDVAFLPTQASCSTTFHKNCGRGESLWTTTCPITVVGGKQGHAPSKTFSLQQILFLCQLNFIEVTRLSQRWGKSGHPQFWGYNRIQNSAVCLTTICTVRESSIITLIINSMTDGNKSSMFVITFINP